MAEIGSAPRSQFPGPGPVYLMSVISYQGTFALRLSCARHIHTCTLGCDIAVKSRSGSHHISAPPPSTTTWHHLQLFAIDQYLHPHSSKQASQPPQMAPPKYLTGDKAGIESFIDQFDVRSYLIPLSPHLFISPEQSKKKKEKLSHGQTCPRRRAIAMATTTATSG